MTPGTKTGIVYCCPFIWPQSLESTTPLKRWLLEKAFLDLTGGDDSETMWILSHIAGSRGANTLNKQTDRGDCLPTTDPPHPLFLHLPHQICHQSLLSVCRGQAPTVWKYGNLIHFLIGTIELNKRCKRGSSAKADASESTHSFCCLYFYNF